MKKCDTCTYRNNVEQLKPCIIYRDNCEYYEKERGDMTREEAITELKILREDYWDDDNYGHETKRYDSTILALDMAIKALEQESKIDLDELKRRILMEVDGGTDDRMLRYSDVCDRISDSIDEYKAEIEP